MTKRKCTFARSTFGSVQETVITDIGTSRTLRANLSKIHSDRLALERQHLESQQEAAIHANNYSNDVSSSFPDFGALDSNIEPVESNASVDEGADEDSEIHTPVTGDERHAVSAVRKHVFACIQGRHRQQHAPRTRLLRNRQMHAAWRNQMPDLVKAFLQWKQDPEHACIRPDPIEENDECETTMAFQISTIDITNHVHVRSVNQCDDELANVSLIRAGYLGGSPKKPSFSVQAMVKVLCALHNRTYYQSLRDQFSVAFDAYLEILRQQLDEPPLYPARLDAFDGNNSLKRVDGSGHADERCFTSSYLISTDEVEQFKDDVRLRPGARPATVHVEPKTSVVQETPASLEPSASLELSTPLEPSPAIRVSNDSSCTDNWKAANTITENTTNVFEETGVFVSACRHGIIQTLVEIRRSGELAKYALATANKLIDVYGPNGVTGYDIGCSFSKTAAASSIADKVKTLNHRFVVNSFHRHAHNRRCQLQYHTLYQEGLGIEDLETCERVFSGSNAVAPLICHASYFHWLQFIDLQFDQWDQDRYQELSQFLYNNYKQALDIINDVTPTVEELKAQLDLTDADFHRWNVEELEYLESLASEVEYDPQKTAYVEALQSLMMADFICEVFLGLNMVVSLRFNFSRMYQPISHNTPGYAKDLKQPPEHGKLNVEPCTTKLLLEMNTVLDLERRIGITQCWTPADLEYQEALKYLHNRQFIRAVQHLEGLVVQRLFELAKANLAGTGYKMRQQISNAITRRSTTIQNALERYNQLAPLQTPPREVLKFSEVASYAWLGEFELLKHSWQEVLTKPWVSKANREVAGKYFKIIRACEEINRLNIEIARLQKWVDDEDAHLFTTATSLSMSNPALASDIRRLHDKRQRVNNVHRMRLQAIYALPGFSGVCCSIELTDSAVIDELQNATPIEVDEDDMLCDEAARLESCIA
ncbi:hypothetical protein DFH29DRAFT_882163 [Suillus ampliporus]|nr:hypothetical protein DFH29DRAFT_882163 [Suillus ampliporus]